MRSLSPRDAKLLAFASAGPTDKAIAREMQLSHFTVSEYMKRLLRTLGAKSRAEAAAIFARQQAAAEAAQACAALCEAEAERLATAAVPDADGIKRNAMRALVARGLGAAIRDQFNLPR